MSFVSEGLPLYIIIVLLGALLYLLLLLIKKLREGETRPPRKERPPKTFIRGLNFDESTKRWKLICQNELPPQDPDTPQNRHQLPEIDPCSTGDNQLAPPLSVRTGDVVVFDFSRNTEDDFAWVELQFPEPDLFVGLGGLPNSFDDYIVRVRPRQRLTLTVRDRQPCKDNEYQSRFVYAMHVVQSANNDPTSPTGYVQGGSPPEIRFEHA